MGSSQSPVIDNFFMEDFEKALDQAGSVMWTTLSSSGHKDPTD
jgi:hypothetical protein